MMDDLKFLLDTATTNEITDTLQLVIEARDVLGKIEAFLLNGALTNSAQIAEYDRDNLTRALIEYR